MCVGCMIYIQSHLCLVFVVAIRFGPKNLRGGGEGGGKGSCFMIGIGYDSLAQCKLFVYLRVRFVFWQSKQKLFYLLQSQGFDLATTCVLESLYSQIYIIPERLLHHYASCMLHLFNFSCPSSTVPTVFTGTANAVLFSVIQFFCQNAVHNLTLILTKTGAFCLKSIFIL